MRSVIFLSSLLPLVIACDNPLNDACAASITASAAAASTFCATYTQSANTASTGLPNWASVGCANKYKKVSSACSCLNGGISTLATVTATKSSNFTLAYSTGTGVAIAKTTSAQTTLAIETSAAASSSDIVAASSEIVASSEIASSTKAATKASTTAKAETTSAAVAATAAAGSACTVTDASGISSAVASCTNIVLSNIAMPSATTLDLTDLQDGTTVTFAGNTSFAYTEDSDFDPITIGGNNVIITGASGHVIDGNGPAYWDGEGSNGGTDKPDHFIVLDKMTSSTISNLNIKNWPVHCFDITGCTGLTITGLTLDNSEGDEPNSASGDDAAAHNSDGFDFSSTNDSILSNTIVKNQDDCVAITSGSNITVTGMTCSGGHGLSIGSVGGKSNNVVSDITFSDSTVTDSENGCRIKSNADTTGSITNIVYQNIVLSGITDYGIDVQQDYLNGGATGSPTNGVTIDGVTFTNVTGTATGTDYYILCGSDSCSNFTFTDVSITGGSDDSCNYPSTGCPS